MSIRLTGAITNSKTKPTTTMLWPESKRYAPHTAGGNKSPSHPRYEGPDRDPGRARTGDLEIRSHMLYPAELQGQT